MMEEVKRQMKLALPLIMANFLIFALQLISIVYVGRANHDKLAGAALAISFANVISLSVLMGLSTALDTLCGQSYGAKQFRMVGLHMQRSMIIVTLVSIPLAFAMAFSGSILILLRQDPAISMAAESYNRWMIPAVFAFGLLQCCVKFLQAQNIVFPIMLCSGATTLLHTLFCWIFTFKLGLGYRGAALSVSVSYWFNLLLLLIYVKASLACKETWTGFSVEAFHGLLDFLKLGVPSTIMYCLQGWQFELLLLFSGLLPNPKLQTSVMSISQNTSALVFMITIGLSAAISTRVSNELGAGNPKAVKLASFTAASIVLAEGFTVGLMLFIGRKIWGQAFTNDSGLVEAAAAMMPWIALSHCIDGFQFVQLGIIKGCGRQKFGAFVCLGSYYIVGIPASIILGFVFHKGVKGLWIGNICAIIVQDMVLLATTFFTDWKKEVGTSMKISHKLLRS
ncbi:MATE efflux family protein LAL5 [Apostasia shenzhenica]|uniref:Protein DETOXIFICATION n=1 Tax=Apostasia shenzhenica TaxID=1088818 RepID=A0A2I0A136_9ASPA|nr:MATE efflux family protein LAL5 [Apostasia shenzhenica]